MNIDSSKIKFRERLPAFGFDNAEELPIGLAGSEIVFIGSFSEGDSINYGRLVIKYRAKGESDLRETVLAFSDLGMWWEDLE